MPDDSKIKPFPAVSQKLSAPSKKSQFERQKAEAEAKRQREEAETAAVYEDFVKSFEEEDDGPGSGVGNRFEDNVPRGPTRGGFGTGGFGGAPKRHFTTAGSRGISGPGSLGPGPPSRKRAFDGSHVQSKDRDQGIFKYEDGPGPIDTAKAFGESDDEEKMNSKAAEKAAPKPTLHLSSLPPGTSATAIKALIPSKLTVDSVRSLPPAAPGSLERKSMSVIVTLAKDTPASDIDSVVNTLQGRYLGLGYYLSISRYLSSAAIGTSGPGPIGLGPVSSSHPFGAKPIPTAPTGPLNRAGPPGSLRGGFAPPSSYEIHGSGTFNRGSVPMQVITRAPSDVKQLKLIHKVIEQVLTHGLEFEALLMSRREVQQDEKWAWLWDARTAGGVYYRWRLWQGTSVNGRPKQKKFSNTGMRVFDSGTPWVGSDDPLKFEYNTGFEQLVSDSDYDSSEADDSGDEGPRKLNIGGAPPDGEESTEKAFLNPLQKARLTHLLSRLPTTTAKLRKGDVARVTAFAISHASSGSEEVVEMIVTNIEKPFTWTFANPDRKKEDGDDMDTGEEDAEKRQEKEDMSSSKLIALWLLSDILSSSSTSGVRHAWRFRQSFENSLKQRKVFESLGRLEKDMQWGRLRAEKWKRSVKSVLDVWESSGIFTEAGHTFFVDAFMNPPLTDAEKAANSAAEEAKAKANAAKSKWKTVDSGTPPTSGSPIAHVSSSEPTNNDKAVSGENISKGPVLDNSVLVREERVVAEPMEVDKPDKLQEPKPSSASSAPTLSMEPTAARAKRQRPKAIDMFADSDED